MTVGELVAANVVDRRLSDGTGREGSTGVYLLGVPGTALPFDVFRAWKVPTGMVVEEIDFFGPSGRLVYRWGPEPRRMLGSMDLTLESDTITDARFDEAGTYLVSFILEDEIVGEIPVPVVVQEASPKLPKDVEDGLRKSDVIWVGVEADGRRRFVPAWFSYKNGRILVLSQREPGPEEQTLPGARSAPELTVVTRRKLRDTALHEFPASKRLLEGAEWEEAAKTLADRRRSRVGPPAESITRWRTTCDIVELTPVLPT
ncbi:MAG TPA: hypothetical protein VJ913_07375 [Actinomycetota bacterium]|nr:hypothetical protein [Actinomycetota bacterium]